MKYEDSVCSLEQLIDADAFSIERHSLRISQPVAIYDDINQDIDGVPDGVRLQCREEGIGSRFGRIDFSKGFSQWWYLSHTDVKTPSEHTQDGKRYDAEIQLHHFIVSQPRKLVPTTRSRLFRSSLKPMTMQSHTHSLTR